MEIIGILGIALFFHVIFCYAEKTTDEYSYFWMTKRRKKIGNLWNDDVRESVIPGYRGYPPLVHYIISRFPEKWWYSVGNILTIASDLISVIIVYIIADILFTHVWAIESFHSYSLASVVTILYATSPILYPVTARLKSMGARTFGNMMCLLYMICFAVAFLKGTYSVYIVCVGLGWGIIISSQFGMQYIVFTSILLSLLYVNIVPLAVLFVTVFLGLIIPQLGFKKIFQRKIDHYRWFVWHKKNYAKYNDDLVRNKLSDFLLLPWYCLFDKKKFITIIFRRSSAIILAYSVPVLSILLFSVMRMPDSVNIFF
ncbi:hypothetical protein ACFL3D_05785, partial [Candidatus Omnitrophota bacterium]